MKEYWWSEKALTAKKPHLKKRYRLQRLLEDYFIHDGLTPVETPALQHCPGMEPHLFAFSTRLEDRRGRRSGDFHLHTSPEFAMKKLLAGGAGSIFQFARVFRNREGSRTHSPEFTMLEWYRVNSPVEKLMEDCRKILEIASDLARDGLLTYQGQVSDPKRDWEIISVVEAFAKYAQINLEESLGDGKNPNSELLGARARARGITVPAGEAWEDIFFRIFLELVEPNLGKGSPTIIYDYPACMAALSKLKDSDTRFAERFELYVCGLELANAFSELTDSAEQRRRFEKGMELKERLYGFRYPIDEDFLVAVAKLPACTGIALGFDRLAMLTAGVDRIDSVLWAPVEGYLE